MELKDIEIRDESTGLRDGVLVRSIRSSKEIGLWNTSVFKDNSDLHKHIVNTICDKYFDTILKGII